MEGRLKLRRMPRARTSACEQPSGARLPELLRCAADLPDAQYSAQSSRGDSSTCTDSTYRPGSTFRGRNTCCRGLNNAAYLMAR